MSDDRKPIWTATADELADIMINSIRNAALEEAMAECYDAKWVKERIRALKTRTEQD